MILGIGLALGGWARTANVQAALRCLTSVFPMMFLSEHLLPTLPDARWLQNVSSFLPLTPPVIDGVRLTTEGKHFVDLPPQSRFNRCWLSLFT